MLVEFNKLPETSRVWIYQANRSFSADEISDLKIRLEEFIKNWTAHGKHLQAAFEIKYNRFIILAINSDISKASGCSIDTSVHFIQELESIYNIDLLDKMNVSYKQGEFIAYKSLKDFRQMAKDRAVSKNTIVFNNLVTNIAEYKENWEVPASDSWHSRFVK